MAHALRYFGLSNAVIWYSPKERTRQTAAALQAELRVPIYHAQDALATGNLKLLQCAWQESQVEHLILVGHQPFLGDWSADLSGVHLPVAKASVTFLREKSSGRHFQFLGHFRVELFEGWSRPEKKR